LQTEKPGLFAERLPRYAGQPQALIANLDFALICVRRCSAALFPSIIMQNTSVWESSELSAQSCASLFVAPHVHAHAFLTGQHGWLPLRSKTDSSRGFRSSAGVELCSAR
jgi:hypothetical protein